MSLEQSNMVDAMGIEESTNMVVLTIADSWDWTDERTHLLARQAKLNAYFEFIETGDVWESYPAASGRQLKNDVIFRFPPPVAAIELLAKGAEVASAFDVLVSHRMFQGDSGGES